MRELAEVLLRGANTLTSAEREMIAAFVSDHNDCHFCHASHRAAAAHQRWQRKAMSAPDRQP
jgi:AhpD family alkylhydroperoxidase